MLRTNNMKRLGTSGRKMVRSNECPCKLDYNKFKNKTLYKGKQDETANQS